MNTLNIKNGDLVKIIAGNDKGKTGKVLKTYPADGKIVVEGVNITCKHKKARSAQDNGGIIKQPSRIDVSNAVVICPACGLETKVGAGVEEKNGKQVKIRVCKKCGASLEVKKAAAKAKKATAKRRTATKKTAETAPVTEDATEAKE